MIRRSQCPTQVVFERNSMMAMDVVARTGQGHPCVSTLEAHGSYRVAWMHQAIVDVPQIQN